MKKLIIAIFVTLVLGACSQSAGDKFVGTWTGEAKCNNSKIRCNYSILEISKNNGGNGYTVKSIIHTNAYDSHIPETMAGRASDEHYDAHEEVEGNFPAVSDGDALIMDVGLGKLTLKINNNVLEFGKDTLTKK